jgi:hypothetical protein
MKRALLSPLHLPHFCLSITTPTAPFANYFTCNVTANCGVENTLFTLANEWKANERKSEPHSDDHGVQYSWSFKSHFPFDD